MIKYKFVIPIGVLTIGLGIVLLFLWTNGSKDTPIASPSNPQQFVQESNTSPTPNAAASPKQESKPELPAASNMPDESKNTMFTITEPEPKTSPVDKQATTATTVPQEQTAEVVATAYQQELNQLQAACSAKVQQLVGEIASTVKAEQSKSNSEGLTGLQSRYIKQIQKEEQTCDSQFNEIISRAQINLGQYTSGSGYVEKWKNTYQHSKEQAQQAAIGTLFELMK